VIEATGSPREAASVLFDPPGYRVIDAVDRPGRLRRVTIAGTVTEAACPSCGVPSARVHQRVRQRLADVPVAGPVEVVLVKRRVVCAEQLCPRRTFVEISDQLPLRARVTTRLRAVVLEAVVTAGRVVAEVAGAHGLSWWTVQKTVNAAADLLIDPDIVPVRRLGIDEHRYPLGALLPRPRRRLAALRAVDDHAGRRRHRPRAGGGRRPRLRRRRGLAGRPQPGLARGGRGGGDRPVGGVPPGAARAAAQRRGQRGRLPSGQAGQRHGHRRAPAGHSRAEGPPRPRRRSGPGQPAAAAARREHPPSRRLGPTQGHPARRRSDRRDRRRLGHQGTAAPAAGPSSLAEVEDQKMLLGRYVLTADMAESNRLRATIEDWWDAIEVLVVTGVTNARTEAANTAIKQIKRTGRGYRNAAHYRARILLASAARRAA
jgi:transposase